jgi:hypothetical protein
MGADDAYATVLSDWEHVPTIARHDDVHSCVHAAGKDHIVVRVSCDRLDRLCRCVSSRNCDIEQERCYLTYSLRLEAELYGQHPLELAEDGIGQHQLDTALYRCFDYPAWWAAGNERRYKHVRVAECAKSHARIARSSSTIPSTSSGASPRVSARLRPYRWRAVKCSCCTWRRNASRTTSLFVLPVARASASASAARSSGTDTERRRDI